MHFEGDKLRSITHKPTNTQVMMEGDVGIGPRSNLVHNWNDSQAELQKGKARRFKLRAFFAKNEGPNSTEPWHGKSKELAAAAAAKKREMALTKPLPAHSRSTRS